MRIFIRRNLLAASSLLLPRVSCGFQSVAFTSRSRAAGWRSIVSSRSLGGDFDHRKTTNADDFGQDSMLVNAEDPAPPSWIELQQIVRDGQLDKLRRTNEHQRLYDLHKVDILIDYKTMYDYILFDKFGLQRTVDSKTGLYCVKRPPGTMKALAENSFPYHVGPNVCHWVLWKLGEACADDDDVDAKQDLSSRLGNVNDFLNWRNPPPLQSLPAIDHMHILVLRGSEQETQ